MAHIRRLPSGLYQATVRLPDGRRSTRTDRLRRVVKDWARDEEARIARGMWRDPRAARWTFAAWQQRWWDARVVEDETRRGDASMLERHVLPQWRDWPLARITRLDVQSWVREMERDGVGRHAIRRAYNLTSKILGDAVLQDVLAESPCRGVELPATPPKAPEFYTRQQVDAIRRALLSGRVDRRSSGVRRLTYPAHAAAVELMVWTGLRWQDVAGLRVGDVDWLRHRLNVVGARTQGGRWKPYPKSSRSRRTVPVPESVLQEVSALVGDRGEDEPLFVSPRGGRPWSGSNWRKVFAEACAQAGVPDLGPHGLRHTAASWLVQDGVPLYDVQELLGHEHVQTTQRYAHLQPGAHQAVRESWARRVADHQRRGTDAGRRGRDAR